MATALTVAPFDAAVERLAGRTLVASSLRSAEWADMPLALRERAFFSAGVENIRTLAAMQRKLDDALRLNGGPTQAFTDRSKFVADMRELLGAAPGDSGELTDLTSRKRLELIHDFQVESATEAARWKAEQDADILDAFPAQELVRVEERREHRDWARRWELAGGKFYGGRMIARKDDPIWAGISRFGVPWPPFDFGSGMGLQDIERSEAEALGVIKPSERPQPQEEDFNAELQASVPDADPATLEGFKDLFGDQVDVGRDGKITWQGTRIANLYEEALRDAQSKWEISLGKATPATTAQAPELRDAELRLSADALRHIEREHVVGEDDPGNRPLTKLDAQLIPHVWRTPDEVRPGRRPGTLEMRANIAGWRVLVSFDRGVFGGGAPTNVWGVRTYYAKREGVQP